MNIFTVKKFLRLRPFDVSTEKGRSDERYRLAFLSMATNLLSRSVAMLVMVLTVSLTIPYLGAERFGVWMTVASFVGMLSFLDLGIGNALTNKVSQVASKNNIEELRRTISGGLGFLFVLGCFIGVLLLGVANALPWTKIIKIKSSIVNAEILDVLVVFCIIFGLSLFVNGIQRVFAGLQRSYEAHLVSLLGSSLSILVLWFAAKQEAAIPYLLLATFGVQTFVSLILLVILANRNLFTVTRIMEYARLESSHLIRVGGLFFILQVGIMVGWGADSLIIASALGAAKVAEFAIIQRLFQLVTQPINVMNAPLWGAYADAHSRGDKKFIQKTLKRSLIFTGIFSFISVVIILLVGKNLVEIWTGSVLEVSLVLLFAYGVWAVFDAFGNALGVFLNGCSVMKPQIFITVIFALCSLPIKYIMASVYGISSMIVSQTIIFIVLTYFFCGIVFREKLNKVLR